MDKVVIWIFLAILLGSVILSMVSFYYSYKTQKQKIRVRQLEAKNRRLEFEFIQLKKAFEDHMARFHPKKNLKVELKADLEEALDSLNELYEMAKEVHGGKT